MSGVVSEIEGADSLCLEVGGARRVEIIGQPPYFDSIGLVQVCEPVAELPHGRRRSFHIRLSQRFFFVALLWIDKDEASTLGHSSHHEAAIAVSAGTVRITSQVCIPNRSP